MEWKRVAHLPAPDTAPMQQHPAYGQSCTAIGSHVLNYLAEDARGAVLTAQVLVRRMPLLGQVAMIARGPVQADAAQAPASQPVAHLVRKLRRDMRAVIVTPDATFGDPLTGSGLLPLMSPAMLSALPLQGRSEDRLSRQHGKWRNRLRRAQAEGLNVTARSLPENGEHWLLDREAAQSKAKRYRRLPTDFTRAWRYLNGPASVTVFTASRKGEQLAAMLFLHHGQVATYHIGWTGPEGRALNAHNLLMWEASELFAADGCSRIDLGTIDTVTAPGLARFKLGSGAVPVPLGHSWMDAPGARMVARLTGTPRPARLRSPQQV